MCLFGPEGLIPEYTVYTGRSISPQVLPTAQRAVLYISGKNYGTQRSLIVAETLQHHIIYTAQKHLADVRFN